MLRFRIELGLDCEASDQVQFLRLSHCLGPFVDAEFAIEIFGVIAYGVEANDQLVGDLLILLGPRLSEIGSPLRVHLAVQ